MLNTTLLFFISGIRLQKMSIEKFISEEVNSRKDMANILNKDSSSTLYELSHDSYTVFSTDKEYNITIEDTKRGEFSFKVKYKETMRKELDLSNLKLFLWEKSVYDEEIGKSIYYHAIQVYESEYTKENEKIYDFVVESMARMAKFLVFKTFRRTMSAPELLKKMGKLIISPKSTDLCKKQFVCLSNYKNCLKFIKELVKDCKEHSITTYSNFLLQIFSKFFYSENRIKDHEHRKYSFSFEAFCDILNLCAFSENKDYDWIVKRISFFETEAPHKDEINI